MERILVDTHSRDEFIVRGREVEALAQQQGLHVSFRVIQGAGFHGLVVTESEELAGLWAAQAGTASGSDPPAGGEDPGGARRLRAGW